MTDTADLEKRLREDAAGYETTSEVLSGEEHSAIAHRLARMSKQRAATAREAADALSSLTRKLEEAREAIRAAPGKVESALLWRFGLDAARAARAAISDVLSSAQAPESSEGQ